MIIVAKTILINSNGLMLLLRRSDTDTRRPLQWDFPGGVVESDELIEIGATREIEEECGLSVKPDQLRLVTTATQTYDDGRIVSRLLFKALVPISDSVRLSYEHDHFKWVDVDTAIQRFQHPFYGAGLKFARDQQLL